VQFLRLQLSVCVQNKIAKNKTVCRSGKVSGGKKQGAGNSPFYICNLQGAVNFAALYHFIF